MKQSDYVLWAGYAYAQYSRNFGGISRGFSFSKKTTSPRRPMTLCAISERLRVAASALDV